MDELTEFDLKLLPDWLKEAESRPASKYADHPGDEGHRGDNRGRSGGRGPERRGPNPQGGDRSRRPGGPPQRQSSGPRDGRQSRDSRGGSGRDSRENREPREPAPRLEPLDLQVEFLPDDLTVGMIVREIKAKFHAYPLFTLARMFLDRPKSHQLKLTAAPGITLYQAGPDGPISSDLKQLEKKLFEVSKDEYYEEKLTEKEAPKGNFTNVAKCRLSGTFLGPTNHHAYQSSLRRLYEERFSRRMKFEEFRREIEIVSDPAAVEAWKEQVSKSSVFVTKKDETPVELATLADAQRHFRETYQPTLIRSGSTLEVNGMFGRDTPDQRLFLAIQNAWEGETRFPSHVAGNLRSKFSQEGLHTFKHRKRIIFVSTVRPNEFTGDMSSLSPGIAAILTWVKDHPNGTRKALAEALLPTGVPEEEVTKAKSLLATDLRWLVHAGHVIEFQNGTLDLPLPAKPREEFKPKQGGERQPSKREVKVTPVAAAEVAGVEAPIAEVEAPVAEVETPIAEVETPIAEVEAPIAEVEAPIAEVEAPIAEVEAPIAELEAPIAEVEAPIAEVETPIAEVEAPIAEVDAVPEEPASEDSSEKPAAAPVPVTASEN